MCVCVGGGAGWGNLLRSKRSKSWQEEKVREGGGRDLQQLEFQLKRHGAGTKIGIDEHTFGAAGVGVGGWGVEEFSSRRLT